jgi:hypothetical protein
MPPMNIREASQTEAPVRNDAVTGRIASIDIFCGLTVLVMVFLDNLDFVKGCSGGLTICRANPMA